MRKYGRYVLLLCMFLNVLSPLSVSAMSATNTYTVSVDGEIIETQTAYEAVGVISNDEISRPEDLFIDQNNFMYIADTGTQQIVVLGPNRQVERVIGAGYLERPTGVAVNAEGDVFVADTEHVFQFSATGELMNQFGRPDSPLFGRTQPFRPRKISLDARGNIYIVGEGASNGIIQLNANGEFLGYFGANRTTLSFFQALQNFVMSSNNLTRNFMNIPIPPTNLDINERGIVFTVTTALEEEAIKKLNIAGTNMLGNIPASDRAIDITVGNQGNFYVLDSDGLVFEYDSTGNLLFVFGGRDSSSQRLGVFRQPTSLAVDPGGNLYVADAESGLLHFLTPTEFTQKVHRGLAYFEDGLYVQSEAYWNEVLRSNSSFALAHIAIGQSQFKQLEYEEALMRFDLANDREGYSEAFWEIRHQWLQENTGTMIIGLISVMIVWKLIKFIDRKTETFTKIKQGYKEKTEINLLKELLLLKRVLRHPIDTFYDIKRYNTVSVKAATIWYVIFFFVFFFTLYAPGFIFASNVVEDMGFFLLTGVFVGILALFIIINYLVSTINEGEGSLAKVYIGTVYAMAPFILFAVPITLLSRVLTLNEAFVYDFSMQIIIFWTLILVFIMVKEIHDYEIGDTTKNILLTLFGALITVVIIFVLYLLLNQVFEFIYSIIQEVLIRV